MQPHQQRVVDEKAELDSKMGSLYQFICSSPVFEALPAAEKKRLRSQACIMGDYSDILAERIAAFRQPVRTSNDDVMHVVV